MKPETWIRVFEIFRRAVALEGPERARFLDSSCGTEPDLRVEVERLLEEDSRRGGLLDRGVLPSIAARPASRPLPERIGPYSIRREIASGGMGTVYEAVQDHPRRTVALKTLRPGALSENAVRRFRLEGEVLGSLQHPGIAQVYETGAHGEDEAPFIAMEYVAEGRDLVASARERGLGLRARIELFLRVCAAVHHGHQRGVIHRDLKPGNLLVDREGQPKVIDFGLARVTDPERHAISVARTEAGKVVGTLQYMSPEQLELSDAGADVLSDVYSLGVVLFELLSGELPYDLRERSLVQMVSIVREGEPRRLGAVDPRLRGELEWITSKAMARERDRRYASVHELAEDLRRYLRHEPVLAGPPGAGYRLRKLVRRHRLGFAAAGAVLLVGTAGLTATWSKAALARRRLEERNVQLEIANEANGFLTRVLSAVRPRASSDGDVTLRDFVDRVAEELEAAPPDHPAVEAQVRSTLAETYDSLGLHGKAAGQYDASLTLFRAEYGDLDERTRDLQVRRLTNLFDKGPLDQALEEASATASGWTASFGPDDRFTLRARRVEGICLWKQVHHQEAEAVLRDVVARLPPPGVDDWLAYASYTALAQVLVDERRADDALAFYDEYVARYGEGGEAFDGEHLLFEANLATLYLHSGRTEEGLERFHAVVPELRRVYGPENPDVMGLSGNLARFLVLKGEHLDEAEEILSQILASSRKLRGGEHVQHVFGMLAAADAYNHLERYPEGEELAQAAVNANERVAPDDTLESYRAFRILGTALARQGKLDEAEEALYEGLGRALEKLPEGDTLVQEFETELAYVDEQRG